MNLNVIEVSIVMNGMFLRFVWVVVRGVRLCLFSEYVMWEVL